MPPRRAATDWAAAIVTRPAPARRAPSPVSMAAPGYSIDPATTRRRPKSPLCARSGRGSKRSATQRSVSEWTAGALILRLASVVPAVGNRDGDRHATLVRDGDGHLLEV